MWPVADTEQAWVLPETWGSHRSMTTLCSGDKPHRKTDLHCFKRDEIQTTLLKRNMGGNVNSCRPYGISTSQILSKSSTGLFSQRITRKTFPIPSHMRSIFYVLKLLKQFSRQVSSTSGLCETGSPVLQRHRLRRITNERE